MMSRHATRNKTQQLARKAIQSQARSDALTTQPAALQTPHKRAVPPARLQPIKRKSRGRASRRVSGTARRSSFSGYTVFNIVLGVVILGLGAFIAVQWYTHASPQSNVTTGSSGNSADASTNNTKTQPQGTPVGSKGSTIWDNQAFAGAMTTQVAQALGLTTDQISAQLQDMTMLELAEKQGMSADQWHTKELDILKNVLHNLASSGQIEQSLADQTYSFYLQKPDHLDDSLASQFGGHHLEHTPGNTTTLPK